MREGPGVLPPSGPGAQRMGGERTGQVQRPHSGERKLRGTTLLGPSSQQPLGLLWGLRHCERKGRPRKIGTPAALGLRRVRGLSTLPCKG